MSSKIVFGTGSRFGRLNKNLCSKLVEYSFKKGVRKFDTGHSYANGNSEKNLGYAFRHLKNFKRNKVFISTKVGTRISNKGKLYKDFSASSIDSQVNSSLENLKLKYIDLLYLHGPEIKDINNQELIEKLIELKNKGLIRKIGVNTHTTSLIEKIAAGKTMHFDQIMKNDLWILVKMLDFWSNSKFGGLDAFKRVSRSNAFLNAKTRERVRHPSVNAFSHH